MYICMWGELVALLPGAEGDLDGVIWFVSLKGIFVIILIGRGIRFTWLGLF